MPSNQRSQERSAPVSRSSRFLLGIVRIWFTVFFRKIRLLHAHDVLAPGPTMLVVSHSPSFLDALIMVAAFERPVHCLLSQRLLRGPLRRLLARGFGMIPYDPEGKDWHSVLDLCCNVLTRWEAIAVFAEQGSIKAGEAIQPSWRAANLALEAEIRNSGQLELAIFPVHLFLPVSRPHSGELLIYVDDPLYAGEYLTRDVRDSSGGARALASRVRMAWQESVFRVEPGELKQFLSHLEQVLLSDLEEGWASRPDWKQKVEGFELSRFVVDWSEEMNYLNPGRLVALREALDEYRERRRRWSLRQFEIELAGAWIRSRLRRMGIWLESACGLPIACYGLGNHLLVWVLLFWFGLLKTGTKRSPKIAWLLRALIVLGCYASQVLLCAHWLGRSAAGFYAPSLPLAGAYLWRYDWLLRHRTRLAFITLRNPAQAAKLRRTRKRLLGGLNKALQLDAEALGVAH